MMSEVRCPIVELRQYTLHPGQRDVLISLFDRELVETQEAEGMTILGQFRDLDKPDRFVWLRGFDDMPRRAEALTRFYTGPAWKANSAKANATMIDSDNVLLLRPVSTQSGFPVPVKPRLPVGPIGLPGSLVLATIYYFDYPVEESFVDLFDREERARLAEAGAETLACLQTEYAENTFPALPVRTGEHVFVSFARFSGLAQLEGFERSVKLPDAAERLRLAPTARSLLR